MLHLLLLCALLHALSVPRGAWCVPRLHDALFLLTAPRCTRHPLSARVDMAGDQRKAEPRNRRHCWMCNKKLWTDKEWTKHLRSAGHWRNCRYSRKVRAHLRPSPLFARCGVTCDMCSRPWALYLEGGGAVPVQKVGYFGPVSPDGQGDRNNYCVPTHWTAQIVSQSKDSDKAMFHTENARLMSKSAGFALQTYAALVVGGLEGGHGKANLLMGAVPTLYSNAPLCPVPCPSVRSVSHVLCLDRWLSPSKVCLSLPHPFALLPRPPAVRS